MENGPPIATVKYEEIDSTMLEVLGWIVFGLIVGVLAKLLVPGRDPGGIVITILLGIAGSLLGGWVGRMLGFYGPGQAGGWIMSILGAVLLLVIYHLVNRRRPSAI
jgi:uncharacterized membrane protein YeaQ/YmgE (transglycosylase-associated protein family)